MSDSTISYVQSNIPDLVTRFVKKIQSQPNLFPIYSTTEPYVLHQLLLSGVPVTVRALESGDFEEVKAVIHQIFTARLRGGFDPNELLRFGNLINDGLLQILQHAPTDEEARRTLYLRRLNAIGQVGKMYIAILNLSIPSEERNAIDPSLLELTV